MFISVFCTCRGSRYIIFLNFKTLSLRWTLERELWVSWVKLSSASRSAAGPAGSQLAFVLLGVKGFQGKTHFSVDSQGLRVCSDSNTQGPGVRVTGCQAVTCLPLPLLGK